MLWEDNYFPLMPGETRELTVTWRARDAAKATLAVAAGRLERRRRRRPRWRCGSLAAGA